MKGVELARGARKLVEVNGRVQPEERVVVVTDYAMIRFAEPVAAAAAAGNAEVVVCVIPIRKVDGEEPPEAASAAMQAADVIYCPVKVSITHTRAVRRALEAGARVILMTAYTEEILTGSALLETDFEAQAEVCRRIGRAFSAGREVRLTSSRGTELIFSVTGREANVLTNIPGPGELAPVPDIEVNVVPVTGSARGRLVADASIPYLGIGVLAEPVVCDIEDGHVTQIDGGRAADVLRRALEAHDDPACYNVAELGVGLNPNARLTGHMLDDEGVLGTIHVGIGTSNTLGGEVVAPTHYDLLMWEPVIEVDGTVIQRDRAILI